MINFLFPNMKKRSIQKELMDYENCDSKQLIRTVKQFKVLNSLFSSSRYMINKHIFKDIAKRNLKEITFLDIGAGGCDIPIWFLKKM